VATNKPTASNDQVYVWHGCYNSRRESHHFPASWFLNL
jgi:hypothetical protein